jgi:hypothetical protein
MTKLNQVIAIEKGVKSRVYSTITELNKASQKPDLFNGFSKTYRQKDEDGEQLPDERKRVQFTVAGILKQVETSLTELMDVTIRKDMTNCTAEASVEVDGQTIIPSVPPTFLLFLEKQLTDMRTFVSALPTLDDAEDWSKDENSGLYKAKESETHRTKKLQKPIVLYDATEKHPAQTQLITEDVIVGWWKHVKQSGGIPRPDKEALAERVEKLLNAVKQAREKANDATVVTAPAVGTAVFGYLLNGHRTP